MTDDNKQNDHDLLITLNVRVQDLIDTIKQMDGTLSCDIGGLKEGKLDKVLFASHCSEDSKDFEYIKGEFKEVWRKNEDHDKDIKDLNKRMYIGIGALAVIQFAYPFIINAIF